jgi:predicted nucleic acid-binding protein
MRVVLDTNVLVSGIFWRGGPHQILEAWAEGEIEVLCSSDNRFLECAISGEADAIVSGDQHLKSLRHFEGVDILSPSEFLKKLD